MVLPPKKCKPLAEPKKKPLAVACEAALDEWQAQTQIERLNGDAAGIDIAPGQCPSRQECPGT
jgi:hypothetical protein